MQHPKPPVPERETVEVPYSILDPFEKYEFRRGVFAANGKTGLSDAELHARLLNEDTLTFDLQLLSEFDMFSQAFRLGLCYGLSMKHTSGPKRKGCAPFF